jgi:peptidoglycan/xylan/chitin deacetylase (PgdA/CDA1 family)
MAGASRPLAALTALAKARAVRPIVTLLAAAALTMSCSAILASGPAAPGQRASPGGTQAPMTGVSTPASTGTSSGTGPGDPQPTRDTIALAVAVAVEPPPLHGTAPTRCPVAADGVSLAKVVHHGSRSAKVVALTFDDGWDAPNVLKILSILEKAKVNATFFPTGQAIKQTPDVWKAVAAGGFPIANHTYDHKKLEGLCHASQLAELAHHDSVLAKELGLTAVPYMRPPYGDYDAATRLAAAEDGEQAVVLWDVDTRDWEGISRGAIITRAMAGTNGSIILMHTFGANTVRALPGIIARYKARGFTFVTVGQLLGIDGPVPFR